MTIHTYGDSHCNSGFAKVDLPGVTIVRHHIGPKLMHSFGRDGLHIDFPLEPSDWLLLACGEIDCRCHVGRRAEPGGREAILEQLVTAYEAQIVAANLPCRIGIYNVVPPPRRATVNEDGAYPFVGSDEERRDAVQSLNRRLHAMCLRRAWQFVDIFQHYADADGFLNPALSDGSVHIEDPVHLTEFLRQHLLPERS